MKKFFFVFLGMIMFMNLHAQILKNKKDSVSYALGTMLISNMKGQGIDDVNLDIINQAIQDGLDGNQVLLYPDEAALCLRDYVADLRAKESKRLKEQGEKFLADNAKKEGVTVLPSGLQYKVINAGEGPTPLETDKVKTHYEGMLIDGTVFDSSYERGEPLSLPVNGVIKGWQEALQKMKVGDKWKLYIPYELAYGKRGAGAAIPPYSTLIFQLELLSIE